MKIFILLLSIYFILFLQCSYTYTISIESTDIPDDLISRFNTNTISYIKYEPPQNFTLQNYEKHCELNSPYYCKDNVCVCINRGMIKPFIELPDQNGHIHRYILVPYASYYGDFTYESNNNETISVSVACKNDI